MLLAVTCVRLKKNPKLRLSHIPEKRIPCANEWKFTVCFFIVNTVLLLRCLSHSRKQLHRVLVNFTPLDAAHDWELWVFCKC